MQKRATALHAKARKATLGVEVVMRLEVWVGTTRVADEEITRKEQAETRMKAVLTSKPWVSNKASAFVNGKLVLKGRWVKKTYDWKLTEVEE